MPSMQHSPDHRRRPTLPTACLLLLALVPTLGAGCATLFRGTEDDVRIESIPVGADVYVDGTHRGQTPLTVPMSRAATHTIKLQAEGHQEVVIQTERDTATAWLVLDLLFGGVWLVVDAVTGGWQDLHPAPMRVMMSPLGQSCETGDCVYLQPMPEEAANVVQK